MDVYNDINEKEEERQCETKEGYIYILFNDMFNFYGDDVFKIGKARNVINRLSSYTTSYLTPPETKFVSEPCCNYTLAERTIFDKLKCFRMRSNREMFKGDINFFIQTLEDVINDVNIAHKCTTTDDQTNNTTIHDSKDYCKTYYQKNKARKIAEATIRQKERVQRIKDTPEYKEQKRLHNKRYYERKRERFQQELQLQLQQRREELYT